MDVRASRAVDVLLPGAAGSLSTSPQSHSRPRVRSHLRWLLPAALRLRRSDRSCEEVDGLLPQISMPEGGLAYGDSSVLDFGGNQGETV